MPDSSRYYLSPTGQPVVETRFHVRYFETDAMRVVHHSSYITWFEEGRGAFTRRIGYPYSRMEAEGISLAVSEISARYHRPAKYDDLVVVATCLAEVRSRSVTFTYEVRRAADGVLLVTGSTSHISVNPAGQAVRMPDGVREHLLKPPVE